MENESKVNMKDGTGRRERAEFRWRGEERGGRDETKRVDAERD